MNLPGRYARPSEGAELVAVAELVGVDPETLVLYVDSDPRVPEHTTAQINLARQQNARVRDSWIWSNPTHARIA